MPPGLSQSRGEQLWQRSKPQVWHRAAVVASRRPWHGPSQMPLVSSAVGVYHAMGCPRGHWPGTCDLARLSALMSSGWMIGR